VLSERVDGVRRDLDVFSVEQRENRFKVTETAQGLAHLTQRFEEHLKRLEERDRRGWVLAGVILGALLAFGAQLILSIVRRRRRGLGFLPLSRRPSWA